MTESDFERLMDDLQVIYRMKAGDTVSQDDVDALNRLDSYWRENEESAVDAHHKGWQAGLLHGGGADVQELQNKLDTSWGELATERAMRKMERQWGVREGARACREMMARFVEQGGDHVIAASIRANWNPEWGDDPGPPIAEPAAA